MINTKQHNAIKFNSTATNSRFSRRGKDAHVRQDGGHLLVHDVVLEGIGNPVHRILVGGRAEDVAAVLDALGPVGAGADREADRGGGTAMDDAVVVFRVVGVDALPRGERRRRGRGRRVLRRGKTGTSEKRRCGQNQFAAHIFIYDVFIPYTVAPTATP